MFDLHTLKLFLEIARQKSVTKAASTLGIVQPALTRRLRLLEDRLGTPLLIRHRRGVELTEAGQTLKERAELIIRLALETEEEIRSESADPVGQVGFGFPPSIGSLLATRFLPLCFAKYPKISLVLQEHYSPAMRDALLSSRLDIGIMSCEAHHPDLVMRPLFEESACLFGHPRIWSFKSDSVTPTMLSDLPIIAPSFMRAMLERQQRSGNFRLRVVAEVDSGAMLREMLRLEAGFFVGPFTSLSNEVARGELRLVRLKGISVSRGLFYHRERPLTRASQAILKLLDTEIQHSILPKSKTIRLLKSWPSNPRD